MEAVPVRCPACGRRLFDLSLERDFYGIVRIKCQRCGSIDLIDLTAYDSKQQARSRPASSSSSSAPVPHLCAPSVR